MVDLVVRDMTADDEYFVTTCSHVNESSEIDACAEMRRRQFEVLKSEGALFKVATIADEHIGFAYAMPIERSSWGPLGHSLMVIPCLYVLEQGTSHGAGRALLASIEQDAQATGRQGLTVTAYRDVPGAEWFMPAPFFERLGYTPVEVRGRETLLWKPFTSDAVPPHFLQPHYVFTPVEGLVVVDLFWNAFCQTSVIEAQRVREVCQEFGDRILLREFRAEDREVLLQYQISRAIYVNGEEIGWGYEAPKDGIRTAIERALSSGSQ
ncbi:GNAT family N-acetyltransferase [Candidatus Bipolaricaulota bacterium]